MFKSWANLEYSARGLTAYLCGDDFNEVRKSVKEDNPDIKPNEQKVEVMSRLLSENLDFSNLESEVKWDLCDKVAFAWCNSEVRTLEEAKKYLDKLVEEI